MQSVEKGVLTTGRLRPLNPSDVERKPTRKITTMLKTRRSKLNVEPGPGTGQISHQLDSVIHESINRQLKLDSILWRTWLVKLVIIASEDINSRDEKSDAASFGRWPTIHVRGERGFRSMKQPTPVHHTFARTVSYGFAEAAAVLSRNRESESSHEERLDGGKHCVDAIVSRQVGTFVFPSGCNLQA
jgi:hypothetical protein